MTQDLCHIHDLTFDSCHQLLRKKAVFSLSALPVFFLFVLL